MIYLYGLIDANEAEVQDQLADAVGLQGPIKTAKIGTWILMYSDQDDSEILPKRRLLLAHTKVLERVLTLGTLLPARFGLVALDLDQVTDLINTRAPAIHDQMAKVKDAVELGIRVRFPRQAALDATLQSDTALRDQHRLLSTKGPEARFAIAEFGGHLAEKIDRRRSAAQSTLLKVLRPLARDHVLRKPEEDTEVLRAEFLIDANDQSKFQDEVVRMASRLDFAPGENAEIEIIGPVPMYNFVRLNLSFDLETEAA